MSLFVDTSAFYAFLVESEDAHEAVREQFQSGVMKNQGLVTSSYIVIETVALLQHRFGLQAVRDFEQLLLPEVQVVWVEEQLHQAAFRRLLKANKRKLNLVDCVSFELMKSLQISEALALDPHFAEAGFKLKPKR